MEWAQVAIVALRACVTKLENDDFRKFVVKEDGDGRAYRVDKKVVLEAKDRGEDFEIGARVMFT